MTDVRDSMRAPEPVGPYPHARRHGDLLYLSGVGPRSRGQAFQAGEPFETQCRRVIDNVRFILEDCGSGWDRMLDVTVFLTHMQRDFPTFNRIWEEVLPDASTRPCRTTVEVGALPTPIDIELKVVAALTRRGPA